MKGKNLSMSVSNNLSNNLNNNVRHSLNRRQASIAIAAAVAASTLAGTAQAQAQAQALSDKPIRIVLPNATGSGVDGITRAAQPALAKALDHPVVVDNQIGRAHV